MERRRLVLIAHGSPDPAWREPFEKLTEDLRAEMGKDNVCLAYMQFISPTLEEVIEESHKKGFSEIKILPLFMAQGGHMKRDIPAQTERIKEKFPALSIKLLPHIGANPHFFEMMKNIIREVL